VVSLTYTKWQRGTYTLYKQRVIRSTLTKIKNIKVEVSLEFYSSLACFELWRDFHNLQTCCGWLSYKPSYGILYTSFYCWYQIPLKTNPFIIATDRIN